MSSLLSAELVATCNALGYFDPSANKYYADDNTLETIKDLIRYLRRDDETHDIRRQLGETKVLQTDLLPLMVNYWEQTDLFDVLLRLLVNLTTPALMLWEEKLPADRTQRNQYLQIQEHLRVYKQAFADEQVWAVLSSRISKILEVDASERDEENGLIIERILILIRNILHVPADPDGEKRPDNDASVHDQVLWALHQSGMLDIILYISSANEQAYYMHILEILCYMLREQTASDLAAAALQRSQNEKARDEAALLAIRHRESDTKQRKAKVYTGTRHSRFGGTFVVKSMKAIGDNELIYHKPLNKLESLNFDADKTKTKTPKNRTPVQGCETTRRSAFSIRLFLKEFCVEFLNGAYNTLMYHAKDRLSRARAQKHDESYYLWALRFFMEFNRCYKFQVKLVSETVSLQAFHFVQQQMENYYDMMASDKARLRLWSKRLHLALLAYKELLLTLCAMDKSADGSVRDSSAVIKSNIFYVLEYRELIITLLVTYDELKMDQVYLKDLIETQHVFLKMLETHCKGGRVMVQAKKNKKNKKPASSKSKVPVKNSFNLDELWDEASVQLSTVLEGNLTLPDDVIPFDASSDVPLDEQKSECVLKIQRKLREHHFEEAIGLLRAAREVWPENECFGSADMKTEDEHAALRDIFLADLGENDPPEKPQEQELPEDDYEDEEDELEEQLQFAESDLKFDDVTKRLAHPKVVRACSLSLRNFQSNSQTTNHCIVKLLHRIAFDSKMATMLFQVSIFRTFQRIFQCYQLAQYKELVKFATFIIRKFFEVAARNESVYMEALFWKSNRDAFDIEEGYGSYQEKSQAAAKGWTELEEDELRRLFMEHQQSHIERDVIDWILENLIDHTRTRRMLIKKLKEMYLLVDYKGTKKSSGAGATAGQKQIASREWGEEEEAQLRELYEQFKDAMDPLTCIMERLEVRRPKNRIVEKLLVVGLIQDRKEVRKKRVRKSHSSKSHRPVHYGGSSDEELVQSDHEDSDEELDGGSQKESKKKASRKKISSKKQQGGSGSNNSKASCEVSLDEIRRLLVELARGDSAKGLDWLKESIQDTVEDLENDPEDGSDEGVPLVPILDYAVSAMNNQQFLNLLRALVFQAPIPGQETYWRIPPFLSVDKLKTFLDLIERALNNTLEMLPATESMPAIESSDFEDEYQFENLKMKSASEKVADEAKTASEVTAATEEIKKADKKDLIKAAMAKKTTSDSELLVSVTDSTSKKLKKRIRMNDSSEDGESDSHMSALELNADDDESDRISFKPQKIYDYSDEEEATSKVETTQNAFRSARIIIDSDDELDDDADESANVNNPGIGNANDQITEDESNKENLPNGERTDIETDAKRHRESDSESDKPKIKRGRIIISGDED